MPGLRAVQTLPEQERQRQRAAHLWFRRLPRRWSGDFGLVSLE
jgi:hypothetical protein